MNLQNALQVVAAVTLLHYTGVAAQPRHYALESTTGLRLVNVKAEPARLQGKRGLRATVSDEFRTRIQAMAREAKARGTNVDRSLVPNTLILIEGLEFSDGIIEAEIAGAPAPGASPMARGFVGIAFRMEKDLLRFEQIYLRPTNGRADDQERRNHSVQYSSHPEWTFDRLRNEAPSKYETYVDLVPGEWTKVKIEVRRATARLYVHGQQQPTLIVNNLKRGAQPKGSIAFTLDVETVAHFRDVKITPLKAGEE
jgi:hypothetical protein